MVGVAGKGGGRSICFGLLDMVHHSSGGRLARQAFRTGYFFLPSFLPSFPFLVDSLGGGYIGEGRAGEKGYDSPRQPNHEGHLG